MDDTKSAKPDPEVLFSTASAQAGYFATAQAEQAGYSPQLLHHHTKTGRFIRVERGLYRLRDYPSSPREEVMAAWLSVGPDSVISHESALDIHGLADVIPAAIHVTVPRSHRNFPHRRGIVVHTTTRPLPAIEITWRDGMRVTAPDRTIVDAAEVGVGPEQVSKAVRKALDEGLATPNRLKALAVERGSRVAKQVMAAMAADAS